MYDPEHILLAHGGGGALTRELVEGVIVPALGNATGPLPDAAAIPLTTDLVMTTDAFVVKPLFFRGGDIGSLSVHGTVNDLAVSGAEPLALSLALIIEEGLPIEILRAVVESVARAAAESGVRVITGDTKVVARHEADGLFITTAGVGRKVCAVSPAGLQPGDQILVSGGIAEHGVAVLSERKGIAFGTNVKSDSASVWPMVKALLHADLPVHAMRDPTRGGLAATVVELANDSGVSIEMEETAIPIQPAVRAACDMLGLDPLTVANEGKLVVAIPGAYAASALDVLRSTPGGAKAAMIGVVTERGAVPVSLRTAFAGRRIVEMPYGEDLPRIC